MVAAIAAAEGDKNITLHDLVDAPRPIRWEDAVVIVHPGDASDEPGISDALRMMTASLRAIRPETHVVVIHRFSSVYMDRDHEYAVTESRSCESWFSEVNRLCDLPHTRQIYTDMLDSAASLLAPELMDCGQVIVTGLWADEADGCAYTIARELQKKGVPSFLDPSAPRAWEREGPHAGL